MISGHKGPYLFLCWNSLNTVYLLVVMVLAFFLISVCLWFFKTWEDFDCGRSASFPRTILTVVCGYGCTSLWKFFILLCRYIEKRKRHLEVQKEQGFSIKMSNVFPKILFRLLLESFPLSLTLTEEEPVIQEVAWRWDDSVFLKSGMQLISIRMPWRTSEASDSWAPLQP